MTAEFFSQVQIQTIAQHFLIAAIWADAPEGAKPRATAKAQKQAEAVAREFIAGCPDLFEAAMKAEGYGSHPDAGSPEAAFGHDLWLTLNGHGVGFWDRTELEIPIRGSQLGDLLTQHCHNSSFRDLYSNGRLYFYRGWVYILEP